jgi:triosephosphate isomerase
LGTQLSSNAADLTSFGFVEVVVAPPSIYLLQVKEKLTPPAQVAAQNCYTADSGAYTGEISPSQLQDANIEWVILGHSERRSMFGDTDKFVADKTKAAIANGLKVILCVGETQEEREKDITMEVNERQLEAVTKTIEEKDWE